MIRPLLAILVAALVAAPVAVAIDGKQAHALLRLAVKATGLTAKEPVGSSRSRSCDFGSGA